MNKLNKNTLIIMLDIDGVLRSSPTPNNQFDPKCVTILNRVLNKYKCEIVLSSDWRHRGFLDIIDCHEFFDKYNISQYPMSYTPQNHIYVGDSGSIEKTRAMQIVEWHNIHNIRDRMKWIVFDDINVKYTLDEIRKYDEFIKLPKYTENNFVRTNNSLLDDGIEEEIHKKINILLGITE